MIRLHRVPMSMARLFYGCRIILLYMVIHLLPVPPLQAQQTAGQRAAALCDSANQYLERGETDTALACAAAAVDLDPESARAHTCLGRVYLEMPNWTEQALECFQTALFRNPDRPETLYWKARAHLRLAPTDVLGRTDARQALKALEHLIDLDPSHPEAFYLCGVIYRDYLEQYDQAAAAFHRQIEANPGHIESRIALLKLLIDTGDWERATTVADELISRHPDDSTSYPFLAAALWKAGRGDEAMTVFERYFGLLEARELSVFFNLGYVLTASEQEEYAALDGEGRNTYWRNYWRSRDPDPETLVNERLLEHFIRVAYARLTYSEREWPWDVRGDCMVRYGEPDLQSGPNRPYNWALVDDFAFFQKYLDLVEYLGLPGRPWYTPGWLEESGGDVSRVDGSGTPERWMYLEEGIQVHFERPVMGSLYLVRDDDAQLVEQMERRMPVISEEEEKIEIFRPLESVVTFRGRNNQTVLEYAIGILPDDFGPFRSPTGANNRLDLNIDLFTPEWRSVVDTEDRVQRLDTLPQVSIRANPLFVHGVRVEADPGEYTLSVLVVNPGSNRQASVNEKLALPDYSGTDLMISDILPAARIAERSARSLPRFIRGDLEVIPLPGSMLGRDQPLFVYFEIYNLSKDRFGSTRYRIAYAVAESSSDDTAFQRLFRGLRGVVRPGGRRAVLSSDTEATGIQETVRTWLEIDMSALEHGTYDLTITVTDLLTGASAGSGLTFRTLPTTTHGDLQHAHSFPHPPR